MLYNALLNYCYNEKDKELPNPSEEFWEKLLIVSNNNYYVPYKLGCNACYAVQNGKLSLSDTAKATENKSMCEICEIIESLTKENTESVRKKFNDTLVRYCRCILCYRSSKRCPDCMLSALSPYVIKRMEGAFSKKKKEIEDIKMINETKFEFKDLIKV